MTRNGIRPITASTQGSGSIRSASRVTAVWLLGFSAVAFTGQSEALAVRPDSTRIIEHWTHARRAQAIPRDLVIDARGYGYLKAADGSLTPHGHTVAAQTPAGKPSGDVDNTPPAISDMNPAADATIGTSYTFSATVSDASGIKSVSFVIHTPGGLTQSFTPTASGDTFSVSLQGFSVSDAWSWHVTAKDKGAKGGNTATSDTVAFTVSDGGGTPPPDSDPDPVGVVTNSAWVDGGAVQTAAGRIYFEMPADKRWKRAWNGYVCSGTVITDPAADRSIIITAAHCVYDDAYKAFARNVLFIPNQDGTSGTGTDRDCANDPLGCWTTSFGVVDVNWTTRKFPDNIEWDYAYYVVSNSGAHTAGFDAADESLMIAAGSLSVDFATPITDDAVTNGPGAPDFTHALGYSYSDDPNFMYCAEDMTMESAVNWWLPACDLSGGASGGPWIQPMGSDTTAGSGPIISVNSWGYTTAPGMAGPRLDNTSASALLSIAACTDLALSAAADGYTGVAVDANTVCP